MIHPTYMGIFKENAHTLHIHQKEAIKMQLTNTLTMKKEEIIPHEPGIIRMYTCGPTVYGYAHIGNR